MDLEWLGFTRKDNAKRLVNKTLVKDVHYTEVFLRSDEYLQGGRPVESAHTMHTLGGHQRSRQSRVLIEAKEAETRRLLEVVATKEVEARCAKHKPS